VRQEPRRRPGERVDRLVLVADDADIRAVPHPEPEQVELGRVRVLELVDAEPAVPLVDPGQEMRVVPQDGRGAQDHVVEVDQRLRLLDLLVSAEHPGQQVRGHRKCAVGLLGGGVKIRQLDVTVLDPRDRVEDILCGGEPVVAGQPPNQWRGHPPLLAQDVRRGAVKLGPEVP